MFWKNIFSSIPQTLATTEKIVKPKKVEIAAQGALPCVFDRTGTQQHLSPLLAKGGEGEIYPLQQKPHILVKRYSADVLTREQAYLEKKNRNHARFTPLI